MTSYEAMETKLAGIEEAIKNATKGIEGIKENLRMIKEMKNPAPCPLEEGKPIAIYLPNETLGLLTATLEVVEQNDGRDHKVIIIRSPNWGRSTGMDRARQIVAQFGKKVD